MLELTIIGNIGRDAEQKDINGRPAITFSVAHSEKGTDGQERTTWVSCIRNIKDGNNALLPYLRKGTRVYVRGKVYTKIYNDTATLNCNVTYIELLGSSQQQAAHQPAQYGTPNPAPTPQTYDPGHPYGGRPAYSPTPTTGQQTAAFPNDQPPY
jgi:single-strand DNA-binding protein